MSIIERFVAYAADFEKTLADDDWSRLGQYFSKDAVYRVESDLFGCELTGPDRIFAGMKKSLDGFDRNFPEREIAMTKGPDVEGDEMRVSWTSPSRAFATTRSCSSSTPTTNASTPRWRTGCRRRD
jgi:hypothetical protein